MPARFVVLSGCSGGGKSTLLAALAARGYRTVEEPGRRIVRAELEGDGRALPWVDLAGFARRAIAMALDDRAEEEKTLGGVGAGEGWTFFDRGLIDAASALQMATSEPALDAVAEHRYHRRVFLTPPWPEIHTADGERRHGFEDAVAEYERLADVYPALGYETVLVPKRPVAERVDFILDALRG